MKRFKDFKSLNENKNTEPVATNKKLWNKVLKLVKGEVKYIRHDGEEIQGPNDGKGFDKYPSKYANQWATKLYNRLGGKWKNK